MVDLALNWVVTSLSTLEQELRRWLRSPRQTEPDTWPIARLQEPNSQDRYHGYIRQFICYCLRVWLALEEQDVNSDHSSDTSSQGTSSDDDSYGSESDNTSGIETPGRAHHQALPNPMKDACDLFPWHGQQRNLISRLYDCLTESNLTADDSPAGRAAADEIKIQATLDMLRSFIFHKIGGQQFRSGLIHFLGVLGIDNENHRLRRASDFSFRLAGVVYCVRVLGAEVLLPAAAQEDQEKDDQARNYFLEQRREFLADGSGTPMSKILSLLAYSKHVAMNTGNAGSVLWLKDKTTLYFQGRAIEIALHH